MEQEHLDKGGYCLVLDLDETLVHYFEVGSEGTFLVRPGCDQFLTEMAEIYEVVIFTAAMQDVSKLCILIIFLLL
jgi:TFIIF-interacting CTD phosphatase-like protein